MYAQVVLRYPQEICAGDWMMHTLESESDLILQILFERVSLGFCDVVDSVMIGHLTRIENDACEEHKDHLQQKIRNLIKVTYLQADKY